MRRFGGQVLSRIIVAARGNGYLRFPNTPFGVS